MNNDCINIAIAEYCGWKNIKEIDYQPIGTDAYVDGPDQIWVGIHPESDVDSKDYEAIPDYCNDLNEIHEAEKTLYRGIDQRYWQSGYGRFRTILGETCLDPYSASALERARAFLKTIGKWGRN